jgi:diaminopimelate decarboxylase
VDPRLPPSVAAAVARARAPTLIYDLAAIAARLAEVAAAARAADVRALFALKSFPHPTILALAAAAVDGFDAASGAEVASVAGHGDRLLSIVDPSGRAAAAAAGWPGRLIVGCETVAQVAAAVALGSRVEIAIRLSASLVGRDPAIGALLEGSGRRRSRFGLDVDDDRRAATLAAMVRAAAGHPVGLHVHHGPITATSAERFVATAHAALAAAAAADLEPRFLDLGGAWHGVVDLAGVLAALRAAVPAAIELVIEPGRRYAAGAGYAAGRVEVAREVDDRLLRVCSLSRVCHLRWSQPELVAPAPRPGEGRTVLVVGPTCYEEDVLGEWTVGPAHGDDEPLPAGAPLVLRNVTGYALAWNTGFAGVPPAEVVTVT